MFASHCNGMCFEGCVCIYVCMSFGRMVMSTFCRFFPCSLKQYTVASCAHCSVVFFSFFFSMYIVGVSLIYIGVTICWIIVTVYVCASVCVCVCFVLLHNLCSCLFFSTLRYFFFIIFHFTVAYSGDCSGSSMIPLRPFQRITSHQNIALVLNWRYKAVFCT